MFGFLTGDSAPFAAAAIPANKTASVSKMGVRESAILFSRGTYKDRAAGRKVSFTIRASRSVRKSCGELLEANVVGQL